MLNHTSGIYDYFDDDSPFINDAFLGPQADWSKVWTTDELLAYADRANHAPYFAPGTSAHYSNTNYILVGLIIERVTGHRVGDEIRARILTPLELKDTSFAAEEPVVTGTVKGYQVLGDEIVDVTATNLSWAWAVGGIVSTVSDLGRFSEAVLAGSLVSASSFAEMTNFAPSSGDGMGLYGITTPSGVAFGMNGESAGFSSTMMRLPGSNVSIVLLANVAPGGAPFGQLTYDLLALLSTSDS